MTDKTQPTAHAEITAPISADLRRIEGESPVSQAVRLLREAAAELKNGHTIGGDWGDEIEALDAYNEHMAVAATLEQVEAGQAVPAHTDAPIDERVTKQMIDAGAKAAREYMARTGGNNLTVIYRAMRAVAPAGGVSASPAQEHATQLAGQGQGQEPAFLQSLRAEQRELSDRQGKLEAFLKTRGFHALADDAKGLLRKQENQQHALLQTLNQRIHSATEQHLRSKSNG